MTAQTELGHTYPHQIHDEVTPEMVRDDMQSNPHAYHEALRPHIDKHLQAELGDAAVRAENNESVLPTRTLAQIEDILAGRVAGVLAADDIRILIESGHVEWAFADIQALDPDAQNLLALACADGSDYLQKVKLLNHLRLFDSKSIDASVAYSLLDSVIDKALIEHMSVFKDINTSDFCRKFIEAGGGTETVLDWYSYSLNGRLDASVAKTIIDKGAGRKLAAALDRFQPEERLQIAHLLMEDERAFDILAMRLSILPTIDEKLVNALIEGAFTPWLVDNLENVQVKDWSLVAKILNTNNESSIGSMVLSMNELDIEPAQLVHELYTRRLFSALDSIERDELKSIIQTEPDKYADVGKIFPSLMDRQDLVRESGFEAYREVLKASGVELPDAIKYNDEIFGVHASHDTLLVIHELLERPTRVTGEARQLGVTVGGPEGIQQLKDALAELTNELKTLQVSDETEALLEHSDLARLILMKLTEYDTVGGYGDHSSESLRRKLEYLRQAREDGRAAPMWEEYVPSRVYEIATSSGKKEKPQWTEDVLKRYNDLAHDILYVRTAIGVETGGEGWKVRTEFNLMNQFMENLREEVTRVLQTVYDQLDAVEDGDPKAEMKRASIQKKIDGLEQYIAKAETGEGQTRFIMNSPAAFQKGFAELEKYPELHPHIRRLTFAWALRKHPNQMEMLAHLPHHHPDIEDMAVINEFVSHIVHEETYREYFSTSKLANKFKHMTGTKVLQDAMIRANRSTERSQTTGLRFVPSRGILMEMSGQIGNACWADKNSSIAEDMPNMTAILMQARPGQANERVIGSALLIETSEVESGEKVLLLRGTNPRENYINKVDPGEFYEAITDYVRQIAATRGMKPAIVIDNHVGGSSTNRPVLYGYLKAKARELERIRDIDFEDTTFNDYDITPYSYAL